MSWTEHTWLVHFDLNVREAFADGSDCAVPGQDHSAVAVSHADLGRPSGLRHMRCKAEDKADVILPAQYVRLNACAEHILYCYTMLRLHVSSVSWVSFSNISVPDCQEVEWVILIAL